MLLLFSLRMTRRIQARKYTYYLILNLLHGPLTTAISLINVLKAAKQDVPDSLFKFGTTVKKKQHDAYGAFFKNVDESKTATKITFDD